MPPPSEITGLLLAWSDGDESALERLMPMVERELRRLAHANMRRERPGHTLQTTALINEAFLRLVGRNQVGWQNRAHFFAISARIMRRILLNYARDRGRAKRGGRAVQVSLSKAEAVAAATPWEVLALEEALERLAAIDRRKSQVVELRYFGGLSVEETAEVLKVSSVTVMRDWSMARAWLSREVSNGA